MAGNHELLTDDYVAGLLATEAKDCSIKYSAIGLEAFQAQKKPANMPKPNTRFLRHIIRDTTTHNNALLAKEAADAQARLQSMEDEENRTTRRRGDPRDIRRRQMGDINAILNGPRSRKRSEKESEESQDNKEEKGDQTEDRRNRRSTHESKGNSRRHENDGTDNHSQEDTDREERRQHRHRHHHHRSHRRLDDDKDYDKDSRRHRNKERRRGNHESDGSDSEESSHRRSRRRKDRSRSPRPRRHRSRSPTSRRERKRRSRSPQRRSRPAPVTDKANRDDPKPDIEAEDSDPLDEFMGPAPPPKYRGRGTVSAVSGIDQRFAEGYDPKTDVEPNADLAAGGGGGGGGEWDEALEALRDRQQWKKNQEERMRAAGFGDKDMQRLKGAAAGAAAQDQALEENVKWGKAGEQRAWDVGKKIGMD